MDALIEPIGAFGGFQKINLLIVGCLTMLSAMYYNLILLNHIEPNIVCFRRHAHNATLTRIPHKTAADTCAIWNNYTNHVSNKIRSPYLCKVDNRTYGLSVSTEWNLMCKNEYVSSIVQSIYLVGTLCAFVGEMAVGKYGRRKASVIFIVSLLATTFVCQVLISDVKMLSIQNHEHKFVVYCAAQFLIGILVYCMSSSTYMHLVDLTTNSYHRLFSYLNIFFFMLGELISLAVFYFAKSWKITNWMFLLFGILAFALFNCFVTESPRWLIESAQYEEAYEILKKIARFNKKKTLDNAKYKDYAIKQMQTNLDDKNPENSDIEDSIEINSHEPESTLARRLLFPKENFYKFAAVIILFNCLSINFFGVSISIIKATQINAFLIILLSSLCGFVGALLCFFNEKLGYKRALLIYLFLLTLSSLVVAVMPDRVKVDSLVMCKAAVCLIGKTMVIAAYNTAIVFVAELYEVKIRMNVMLILNCAGCVLTLVTPQIGLLRYFWKPSPYVIYTCTAFVAFVIVNKLKEPKCLQRKKKLNMDMDS